MFGPQGAHPGRHRAAAPAPAGSRRAVGVVVPERDDVGCRVHATACRARSASRSARPASGFGDRMPRRRWPQSSGHSRSFIRRDRKPCAALAGRARSPAHDRPPRNRGGIAAAPPHRAQAGSGATARIATRPDASGLVATQLSTQARGGGKLIRYRNDQDARPPRPLRPESSPNPAPGTRARPADGPAPRGGHAPERDKVPCETPLARATA